MATIKFLGGHKELFGSDLLQREVFNLLSSRGHHIEWISGEIDVGAGIGDIFVVAGQSGAGYRPAHEIATRVQRSTAHLIALAILPIAGSDHTEAYLHAEEHKRLGTWQDYMFHPFTADDLLKKLGNAVGETRLIVGGPHSFIERLRVITDELERLNINSINEFHVPALRQLQRDCEAGGNEPDKVTFSALAISALRILATILEELGTKRSAHLLIAGAAGGIMSLFGASPAWTMMIVAAAYESPSAFRALVERFARGEKVPSP